MKNIVLSAVAVLAMSSFAVAGGDIAPVEEPVVVVEEPAVTDAGFYLGLGYGWQALVISNINNEDEEYLDENFGSIMIDAGYKFNSYVAVEGRYWFGLSSSNTLGWRNDIPSDVTIDSWGIYVKPMYPVSDAFDIYALLGYGSADVTYELDSGAEITSDDVDGFSWGIGAEYSFSDNVSMYIDYTQILLDKEGEFERGLLEFDLDTVNIGVNYRF